MRDCCPALTGGHRFLATIFIGSRIARDCSSDALLVACGVRPPPPRRPTPAGGLAGGQSGKYNNCSLLQYPFVMYLLRQVAIKWNLGDNEGGEKRVEYFSLIGCHSPIM